MDWKDLEKLTIVKLREEALKHPEQIKGVHGKSKAQLMDEIANITGIEKPHIHLAEEVIHTKDDLKHKIHALKAEREKLIAAKDRKKLHELRREMHTLKRRIRKIEHAAEAKG